MLVPFKNRSRAAYVNYKKFSITNFIRPKSTHDYISQFVSIIFLIYLRDPASTWRGPPVTKS